MSTTTSLCVLIVDDDADIRDLVVTYLGSQGITVIEADSEHSMHEQMAQHAPDVILLDVNLGAEDGFAIARKIRNHWNGGLIMVTGRGDTIDRVVGLEIGADDYVIKPFELRELLARVRSVARRSPSLNTPNPNPAEAQPSQTVRQAHFDRFRLTPASRELRSADNDTVILLTTGEYDILLALAEGAGRVLSRDALLRQTHNRHAAPFDRTIDVQIGRLRRKLGDDGKEPRIIKSIRGAGYMLAPPLRWTGANTNEHK